MQFAAIDNNGTDSKETSIKLEPPVDININSLENGKTLKYIINDAGTIIKHQNNNNIKAYIHVNYI